MYAKYVKGEQLSPTETESLIKQCADLYQAELKLRNARLRIQSRLDYDVSFVHVGEVLELDRELLAEQPDSYCIKVRNTHSKRIEYITKQQLRK